MQALAAGPLLSFAAPCGSPARYGRGMRWLVLVLAACAHVPVSTQPSVLALHAPELAATGHARIEVDQGGTQLVEAEEVVAITLPGDERHYLWGLVTTGTPDETRSLTIRNLITACPGNDCLATRAIGTIKVGERKQLDLARFGMGIFGATTTLASIACLSVCHDPSPYIYVGTVIALTTLLLPLSTVF